MISICMTVTSRVVVFCLSVCKTGDSNNRKMHNVFKIASWNIFQNWMYTDKKGTPIEFEPASPDYECMTLPIRLRNHIIDMLK